MPESCRSHEPPIVVPCADAGLQNLGRKLIGEQAQTNRTLYTLMLKKQGLVARARRDVALKARLNLWLYFHVPLSVALLAALATHIVSVFFYW